jgi:uncharacterized membrane protein
MKNVCSSCGNSVEASKSRTIEAYDVVGVRAHRKAWILSRGGTSVYSVYVQSNLNLGNNTPRKTPDELLSSTVSRKNFDHFKGLSMVLLGAVIWGVSGTAAQVLFQSYGFSPGWVVTVRMSIAGLLLLIGVSIRSGPICTLAVWKDRKDAARLILLGIVGLLGVQYSYFASIRYGNAATATMLQYMGPIFITVYVALRRRRMPSVSQLTAVFLALTGAFLLVTNGDWHSFSVAPLLHFTCTLRA